MDVTEETFEADVVERSHELPVVVDFWADWCGPCHALAPVLEREVAARDGALLLAKVDVDANPNLAHAYGISGIPAVKAFRRGRVVDEFVGVRSAQGVADFVDRLTGPTEAERLLGELRADGEWAGVAEAIEREDFERAFDALLDRLDGADADTRESVRRVMVRLFQHLGHDDPLAARYRRRLATALY